MGRGNKYKRNRIDDDRIFRFYYRLMKILFYVSVIGSFLISGYEMFFIKTFDNLTKAAIIFIFSSTFIMISYVTYLNIKFYKYYKSLSDEEKHFLGYI